MCLYACFFLLSTGTFSCTLPNSNYLYNIHNTAGIIIQCCYVMYGLMLRMFEEYVTKNPITVIPQDFLENPKRLKVKARYLV